MLKEAPAAAPPFKRKEDIYAVRYAGKSEPVHGPVPKPEIDGDDVYVTVMEAEPTPGEGRAFETHSRYMDLQMDLEGAELCEVALGDVEEAEPYDEEKDFALWNGAASAALVLGEGRFAVFMVEEPHKPAIKAQGCDKVKKAVFKIAY